MRILILNQSFHPDVVAVAQHASDLAAALALQGHDVTIVCERRAYTDPVMQFPAREIWQGCVIRRLPGLGLGKRRKWRRVLDSLWLLAGFALELLRLPKFDLIIAMTHPPLVSVLAAVTRKIKGGRLVSWVMDLNPDEAIAAGWLAPKSATARVLNSLLRFSLRQSDHIVVMDRFMQERIRQKGIPAAKVTPIAPWSHDDSLRCSPAARQSFRESHGLDGKFVVMYSGNLSPVHPLDTLLLAAERLRDRSEIQFCFIGGGGSIGLVQSFIAARGLRNITCLPYQPRERLGASLSSGDLHVVVMGDAMVGIVHPCKVYNVLSLGIPVLHIGPDRNHIIDIFNGTNTAGAYHARHGDIDSAVNAVLDARARRATAVPEFAAAARAFSHEVLVPRMIRLLVETAALSAGSPLPMAAAQDTD